MNRDSVVGSAASCGPYAHIIEKPVGPVVLAGLAGKIKKARLLSDGSEMSLGRAWNVPATSPDATLTLPGSRLPDELDTVVSLELT